MQSDKEKQIIDYIEKKEELDKKGINKREEDKKNKLFLKRIFLVIHKIFINILTIVALIIIFFTLNYIFQIKVKKQQYANMFGYTFLEVKSGSMEKEILIGDLVIVKLLDKTKIIDKKTELVIDEQLKYKNLEDNIENIKEKLELNDIVTFEKDGHLITHRIIELNNDQLITKGDANNTQDKPILYSQVIGKVVYIISNIGIWKKVFLERQVLIPFISGILLLIIAILIDTEENKKEKKDIDGKKKKIQKGKRFKK